MPKYYKFCDLDELSIQDIANIKGNARALQRASYFNEAGFMQIFGTEIAIVFLEKLGGLKGGRYSVKVTGKVNESHIAISNRDLYDYLVGIMIKVHISRANYDFSSSGFGDFF